MNDLERFKAVCSGGKPDYVPSFGLPGASLSRGAPEEVHRRLVATGMPAGVDGCHTEGRRDSIEGWCRYWGTAAPIKADFFPAEPARGVRTVRRVEGDFEVLEAETGAVTRRSLGGGGTYAMPHFEAYPVRDRASWNFYRERMSPGPRWPADRIEAACRRFDGRRGPLYVDAGKTWGQLRDLMGPETACTILYDDPGLAHEIIDWQARMIEEHVFPLVERLRPEIVGTSEDCCFNHGMFFSPAHFEEFCAPFYRKLGALARACGTDMVAVDTDGRLAEVLPLLEACGVNAVHPCEAKAGNDLLDLGRRHPEFIFLGWLEKECLNEGQGVGIRAEIAAKVPPLLARGRYFPNIDHLIQPLATFENLCRFMTELHEATGNPEGEFPRTPAAL